MNQRIRESLKKHKKWIPLIEVLRTSLASIEVDERVKWGKLCFCHKGRNIAIVQPFKNYLGLMYFKGKLLKDNRKILVDNGPNSQSAARLEFRSVDEVKKQVHSIRAYMKNAIEIELSGQKAPTKKRSQSIPIELKSIFRNESKYKRAFESLTPGRKRGYILYFSAPKQSTTRYRRIEKCRTKIMKGQGLNDK